MMRQLVMSSTTSLDYVMSYSWRQNIQSFRIRTLAFGWTIRVEHLRTHYTAV